MRLVIVALAATFSATGGGFSPLHPSADITPQRPATYAFRRV
ncbi:MAG TPA: hypothetical protein VKB88_26505 [Bryobacteraceae bacterium]|nr:hypothetical protein [Bryobacteraceae bacterium]